MNFCSYFVVSIVPGRLHGRITLEPSVTILDLLPRHTIQTLPRLQVACIIKVSFAVWTETFVQNRRWCTRFQRYKDIPHCSKSDSYRMLFKFSPSLTEKLQHPQVNNAREGRECVRQLWLFRTKHSSICEQIYCNVLLFTIIFNVKTHSV